MFSFFNLPHACVLLLLGWLGQNVLATTTPMPDTHKMLRAATRRGDLYKRSMKITKRFEAEVVYAEEENGWSRVSTFASQVKVGSQRPILNLEDVEHHLQDVRCGDGKMEISFLDKVSAQDAYHACRENGEGLVITSHHGCNIEGERAVYRIHDVSFANDGEGLELNIIEASWQDAFHKFDISFGHTAEGHIFRRHSDFAKIRKKGLSFDVEVPDDTPDSVTSATIDLHSELINKTFGPEQFLSSVEELGPLPALPFEFGCRNCSTRGQIVLTQGAIQIDLGKIDLIPDFLQGGDDGKDISSMVTGGYVELSATGLGARLELFARPTKPGAFEIPLFPVTIYGFQIPGIGFAGALFEPRIAFSFNSSRMFEMTYGIDVAVPDGSNIRLELTDIADSSFNGFSVPTLTPLPFNTNITDDEILLSIAFKPTIPVGFRFTQDFKVEATASLNLPRLDAKLSRNTAEYCLNTTKDSMTSSTPSANEEPALKPEPLKVGALTVVEANMSLTIDVGLGLGFFLLPPPLDHKSFKANLYSTAFPLITSCVDARKALPPMTVTVERNEMMPSQTPIGSNTTVYTLTTECHKTTEARTPFEGNTSVYMPTTKSLMHTPSANSTAKVHVTIPAATANYGAAASHVVASSVAHVTVSSTHAPVVTPSSKCPSISVWSQFLTNFTHAASTAVPVLSVTLNSTVASAPSATLTSTVAPALSTQTGPSAPLFSTQVSEVVYPAPTVFEPPGFLNGTGGVSAGQTAPMEFNGGAVGGTEVLSMRWKAVGVFGMSLLAGAMVM